jgi:hypothetical protein
MSEAPLYPNYHTPELENVPLSLAGGCGVGVREPPEESQPKGRVLRPQLASGVGGGLGLNAADLQWMCT